LINKDTKKSEKIEQGEISGSPLLVGTNCNRKGISIQNARVRRGGAADILFSFRFSEKKKDRSVKREVWL
jgi:hypothetical protein